MGDRIGDHGGKLIVVELGGQVTGQHVLLGPLRGRLVIPASLGEGCSRFPASLSFPGQDFYHLIVGEDAAPDPAVLDAHTQAALGWPSREMLAERAVEQAVISGAEVTVLPADTPELVRAGGAAAILRY